MRQVLVNQLYTVILRLLNKGLKKASVWSKPTDAFKYSNYPIINVNQQYGPIVE